MTLLQLGEHMSDRHRKTCSDNGAVISKTCSLVASRLWDSAAPFNSGRLYSLRHCLPSRTGSTNLTFTQPACLQERAAHPDDFTWGLAEAVQRASGESKGSTSCFILAFFGGGGGDWAGARTDRTLLKSIVACQQ